jgi:hypothetical protein
MRAEGRQSSPARQRDFEEVRHEKSLLKSPTGGSKRKADSRIAAKHEVL